MAPSPGALSKSRVDADADLISSAAAVFGVLDVIDEMATDSETRNRTTRARRSAEAALRDCGLGHEYIRASDEWCYRGLGARATTRSSGKSTDPLRGQHELGGEILPFMPRPDRSA